VIWMSIEKAEALAEHAHVGRRDKLGYEEIDHVRRVASSVSEIARAVAWLHDTVEDGLLSFRQLYSQMHTDQFEALLLLTRDGKLTYMDYIRSISNAGGLAGSIAQEVKCADLVDNITRPCPPEMMGMRERDGRYGRAAKILGVTVPDVLS
jgi:hypothetical protein